MNEPPFSDLSKAFVLCGADVHHTVLEGEAVLLNLDSGFYYSLNQVGTMVWDLFKQGQSLAQILSAICERFAVAEKVAEADLLAFVKRLCQEGLIQQTGK
jgi:hypothetical protein